MPVKCCVNPRFGPVKSLSATTSATIFECADNQALSKTPFCH
jgi:hypothetical protein